VKGAGKEAIPAVDVVANPIFSCINAQSVKAPVPAPAAD